MSTIAGSTILITGAARGLGRELALACAGRGGRVILWDIDAERLAATAADVARVAEVAPRAYACDVGDREMVGTTARRVAADVGRVDILVNNAAVISGRRLLDCSDRQIERTMAVNALGSFWTCRAFLPGMIAAGRGHVVTVASTAGLCGVAGLVDYSASKSAAVGFDEALRMELRRVAPRLVTTVVCPHLIDTGFTRGVSTGLSWLAPVMRPEAVAARLVRAVERDERVVIVPPFMRLLPVLRVLPAAIRTGVLELLGVHRCMDTFVGREAPPAHAPGQPGGGASMRKSENPSSMQPTESQAAGRVRPEPTQETEQ